MDDPLIAFHLTGDDAVFCPVSWRLHGPTLFHDRAQWPSSERGRPRSAFARLALPDRPSRKYAVLGLFRACKITEVSCGCSCSYKWSARSIAAGAMTNSTGSATACCDAFGLRARVM